MRGMDEPYDYEAQQADERRMQEAERDRFLAAHPGYEQCPNHPERPVVDAHVSTKRFCAECVENHQSGYAEYHIKRGTGTWRDWEHKPDNGWLYGAGEQPSSYLTKEPK